MPSDGGSNTLNISVKKCLCVFALGLPGLLLDSTVASVATTTAAVACVDLAVGWTLPRARYFALHAAVNITNVLLAKNDVIAVLTSPNPLALNTCSPTCASKAPLLLTMALHVWHVLAYRLKQIDCVHHVPTIAVCSIALFMDYGPVFNLNAAISMGLPGALDYAALALVKYDLLDWTTEKRLNEFLNTWVRAPMGTVAAYLMVQGAFARPDDYSNAGVRVAQCLIGVNMFANGTYFMRRAIVANTGTNRSCSPGG